MPRPSLILCLALTVIGARPVSAQQPQGPVLHGRIAAGFYYSATGSYRIPLPVRGALGGQINDTDNLVIFQDDFNTYLTVTAIPMDPAQRWDLDFYGLKNFLARYFMNAVLPEFKQACPGVQVDVNGYFIPNTLGGAMLTYALLPGGSMFASKLPSIAPRSPPVAKRGFLVFAKDGFTYVISSELAERAIEGSAYHLSPGEEDTKLRMRLLEVANKIQFLTPPVKTAAVKAPGSP